MTSGVKYSSKQVKKYKDAILKHFEEVPHGTFSGACMAADVPVAVAYRWRNSDLEFNAAVLEGRRLSDEIGGDYAENKLQQCIKNGEFQAIKFYLSTRHKARGYIESTNLNHGGQRDNPIGQKIEVVFIDSKAKPNADPATE